MMQGVVDWRSALDGALSDRGHPHDHVAEWLEHSAGAPDEARALAEDVDWLTSVAAADDDAVVVDLRGRDGTVARACASTGARVVTVISDPSLRGGVQALAEQDGGAARLAVVADADVLPDESADVVLLLEPDADVLARARRLLTEDGRLVVAGLPGELLAGLAATYHLAEVSQCGGLRVVARARAHEEPGARSTAVVLALAEAERERFALARRAAQSAADADDERWQRADAGVRVERAEQAARDARREARRAEAKRQRTAERVEKLSAERDEERIARKEAERELREAAERARRSTAERDDAREKLQALRSRTSWRLLQLLARAVRNPRSLLRLPLDLLRLARGRDQP